MANRGGKFEISVLQEIPDGSVIVVSMGLANHMGTMVMAIPADVAARDGGEEATAARHLKPGIPRVKGYPVSRFLASPYALILGTEVSRRDLIRYVTNKLGGVHFDSTRNKKADAKLELLDKLMATKITAGGKEPINLIYVELLSIMEFLSGSGDAARFRDTFARVAEPRQAS